MGTIFFIVELIGTVAFAISGALVAIQKRMDVFGVMTLGVITAVGGGVIRDIIIGRTPPAAFENPTCALVALGIAGLTFTIYYLYRRRIMSEAFRDRMQLLLFVADTAGLAVFTVLGLEGTLRFAPESNSAVLLFVGLITGVGGGIVRDILCMRIPYVFRKHVYALASLFGALVMLLLMPRLPLEAAALLGAAVVILIRVLAFHYKWDLPRVPLPEE